MGKEEKKEDEMSRRKRREMRSEMGVVGEISLVVQSVRLCAPNIRGPGSILAGE